MKIFADSIWIHFWLNDECCLSRSSHFVLFWISFWLSLLSLFHSWFTSLSGSMLSVCLRFSRPYWLREIRFEKKIRPIKEYIEILCGDRDQDRTNRKILGISKSINRYYYSYKYNIMNINKLTVLNDRQWIDFGSK